METSGFELLRQLGVMVVVSFVCFVIVVGLFYIFGTLVGAVNSPGESELSVEKETSMVERVRVISSQWDGCWLSVGEEDNALYWKCDGFTSKIGDWYCFEQKEAVE